MENERPSLIFEPENPMTPEDAENMAKKLASYFGGRREQIGLVITKGGTWRLGSNGTATNTSTT